MPYKDKEQQRLARHRHYIAHKQEYYERARRWRLNNHERWLANKRKYEQQKKIKMIIEQQEQWLALVKQNICRGISTLTLPQDQQDLFWSLMRDRINQQFKEQFPASYDIHGDISLW